MAANSILATEPSLEELGGPWPKEIAAENQRIGGASGLEIGKCISRDASTVMLRQSVRSGAVQLKSKGLAHIEQALETHMIAGCGGTI